MRVGGRLLERSGPGSVLHTCSPCGSLSPLPRRFGALGNTSDHRRRFWGKRKRRINIFLIFDFHSEGAYLSFPRHYSAPRIIFCQTHPHPGILTTKKDLKNGKFVNFERLLGKEVRWKGNQCFTGKILALSASWDGLEGMLFLNLSLGSPPTRPAPPAQALRD